MVERTDLYWNRVPEGRDTFDLNSIRDGQVVVIENPTNGPGSGIFYIFTYIANINGKRHHFQAAYNATTGAAYKRVYVGGTWSSWSAWDPSGAITELALSAGSQTAPSLSFVGDSNTGMWAPAADTIAFSTGSAERLRITSSGHVGIGVNPTVRLSVADSSAVAVPVGRFTGGSGGTFGAVDIWANSSIVGFGSVIVGQDFKVFVDNNSARGLTVQNTTGNIVGSAAVQATHYYLGGITSSHPSIRRSSAELHGRLGDDSAFCNVVGAVLEAKTSVKFADATTQTTAFAPHTGSTALTTSLPIGHTILVNTTSAVDKNSTTTIYAGSSSSDSYNIAGTGSALTGTWRARGSIGGNTIYERVA